MASLIVHIIILCINAIILVRLSFKFKTIYNENPLRATIQVNVLLYSLSDTIAQTLRCFTKYKAENLNIPDPETAEGAFYRYILSHGRPRQVWLDEEGDNLAELGLAEEEIGATEEEAIAESKFTEFDFRRLGFFALYGGLVSFVQCPWYGFLRSAYNHESKLVVVVQRVIADQVFYSPIMLSIFLFYLSSVVERQGVNCIKQNSFWLRYVNTLLVNLCVWPLAQFTNFLIIPSPLQIPFSSSLSVVWNTYLSLNTQ